MPIARISSLNRGLIIDAHSFSDQPAGFLLTDVDAEKDQYRGTVLGDGERLVKNEEAENDRKDGIRLI